MTDQRIGQGRENAKQYLEANKDIAVAIEAAIRGQCRPPLRRLDRCRRGRRADE